MDETSSVSDAKTDNLYPALVACFTVIICGYVAGRLKIITLNEARGLATFVGNFALPSLIFLSLAEINFDSVNWLFLLAAVLAKSAVFVAVVIVTVIVSKPLNLGRAGLFAMFCTFSTDYAMGYPIIVAVYRNSHPEYTSYLYLIAQTSFAILNPISFVLLEINKHNETRHRNSYMDAIAPKENYPRLDMLRRVLKGIILNPSVFMTILGIIANFLFKSHIPNYLSAILQILASAFSGGGLFLIGLHMVGQLHRLRGPALLLPTVLIIAKLLVSPILLREAVSLLKSGSNATDTESLGTFAFIYGTIPTSSGVFVFSNQYDLDVDLIASSLVFCTFISAPLMTISARMITINDDYIAQIETYAFGLSIIATAASFWLILVFLITKKYTRMPHKITLCLIISQVIMTSGLIWGRLLKDGTSSTIWMLQEYFKLFGMISSRFWTAILAVTIFFLESRGPCFTIKLWPLMCFIAWLGAAVLVFVLMMTQTTSTINMDEAVSKIGFFVLFFSLIVTILFLVLYKRLCKQNGHCQSPADDLTAHAATENNNETTCLIENQASITSAQSPGGKYGTVKNPQARKFFRENSNVPSDSNEPQTTLIINGSDTSKNMEVRLPLRRNSLPSSSYPCPPPTTNACQRACLVEGSNDSCSDMAGLQVSGSRGRQMLRHTIVVIAYSASMFISIAYIAWSLVLATETGIYVELKFLDITLNYGQSLILWALFAMDLEEILDPIAKCFWGIWYGANTINLPLLDELTFVTKHVCDQFIIYHLDRCKQTIGKDIRWRMQLYHGAFRGSCLVQWLVECGIAHDSEAAVIYGRHLLDGRVIAHVHKQHHFQNSPLLYTFI